VTPGLWIRYDFFPVLVAVHAVACCSSRAAVAHCQCRGDGVFAVAVADPVDGDRRDRKLPSAMTPVAGRRGRRRQHGADPARVENELHRRLLRDDDLTRSWVDRGRDGLRLGGRARDRAGRDAARVVTPGWDQRVVRAVLASCRPGPRRGCRSGRGPSPVMSRSSCRSRARPSVGADGGRRQRPLIVLGSPTNCTVGCCGERPDPLLG
jgi:hypothetical protein